jgi:cell division protein FtsB
MTQPPRGPGRAGPPRPTAQRRTATQGRGASASPNRGATSGRGVPHGRGSAPDPGRSAAHPAGTRRPAAPAAARRTNAPQPHRLTGRATVIGLVLGALLLAYAYPVRIYLEQQSRIAALEASQAAQRARISQLADESAKWDDPTYVASQATRTLQMVRPGSTVYFVGRAAPSATASADPDTGRARATGPWYGQLWSSVQAADKPRPAP